MYSTKITIRKQQMEIETAEEVLVTILGKMKGQQR